MSLRDHLVDCGVGNVCCGSGNAIWRMDPHDNEVSVFAESNVNDFFPRLSMLEDV